MNVNKYIIVSADDNYLKGVERAYVGKVVEIGNSAIDGGRIKFEIGTNYGIRNYIVARDSTNGLLIFKKLFSNKNGVRPMINLHC